MDIENIKNKNIEFLKSPKLSSYNFLALNTILILVLVFLIYKLKVFGISLFAASTAITFLLVYLFKNPKLGIIISLIASFFVTGLARYIPAPWGLSIDFILVLTYVAMFFKNYYERSIWKKSRSFVTILISFWMFYIFIQLLFALTLLIAMDMEVAMMKMVSVIVI